MKKNNNADFIIEFEQTAKTNLHRKCQLCRRSIYFNSIIVGISDNWARLWIVCQDCAETRTWRQVYELNIGLVYNSIKSSYAIEIISNHLSEIGAELPYSPWKDPGLESIGELSNGCIHYGKIWNIDYIVKGLIDELRIRTTELHKSGDLHDGTVTDLATRDNNR